MKNAYPRTRSYGMTIQSIDALIIGGGPAGLSAALYLGRARKTVCVVDAGTPRHAVSQAVHNFLTRDGMPPDQLRSIAWEQMKPYSTASRHSGHVEELRRDGDIWIARNSQGSEWHARAVLLAIGVQDVHPDIPGYQQRWGHSIHHCPYCHGWELRDRPVAILAQTDEVEHFARVLRGWTHDLIVLTHGAELSMETMSVLQANMVSVETAKIASLEGPQNELREIVLNDGTRLERQGLFVMGEQRPMALVESLPVEREGPYVRVNEHSMTSEPGLWAAGDCTSRYQQVLEAAAQGARAAVFINMHLVLDG